MMETNLRKGGLVHQVPCSKSREKLQEFCLYRQRKLKILNVEDERSLNGQKEILVNFRMMQRYIYIYIYIYICIYLCIFIWEKHYRLPRHHFIYFGCKRLLYIYRDAVKIINLPVEIVSSLPNISYLQTFRQQSATKSAQCQVNV